ncbi:DNA-binding response regulator [Paenibacillus sp. 598K]|uniref:helix-turn-helix domain-containing protein n=1 Tax=Paenibacillus sp. 598K TaxID=1117987 RepID=UPI000FFA9BD3|nr:helix-turn-helix domain-containing protein [Paenibacillus sp. 598K]GBF71825.1 DNA-binding response regulator [Paenibacillus sp. 598K]
MGYRAIVADDERRVRSAIIKQANWETHGITLIGECQDGDDLLETVARERPELVLTDMRMPGLSGAELVRELRVLYPEMQLIVISGYDDFVYMKQAIASRVVDYLLKPVRREVLDEALGQAVRELEARQREREQTLDVRRRLNESLPLLSEDLFHQWMTGTRADEEALLRSLDLPHLPSGAAYAAVVCTMDNLAEIAGRRFDANPHLLLYAIVNIVNELFDGQGKWFRSRQQESELIAVLYRPLDRELLAKLLEELERQLRQLLGIAVRMGVGNWRASPQLVRDSLHEARAALSWLHAGDHQARTAYYDQRQGLTRPGKDQTGGSERRLAAAVDSGSLTVIRQTVEAVYAEAEQSEYLSIASLRKLNSDLLYQLERLVDQMEDQRTFFAELASLRQQVVGELSPPFVQACAIQFLDSISRLDRKQRKERKVIYDIRDYLERDYRRKHSLKELSERFYLSKEYISKMFKEEFGANLFEYLAELKIDHAKQMLMNRDVKLRQIVDELGFNDESHLSKAFKKHTGCSPKAYREQIGSR